jgi:hypothetical protein
MDAHEGPAYNLNLCQRCLALYVSAPPPLCKHCHTEKEFHKEICGLPCRNCGKGPDAHIDKKCLFEASEYKGPSYEI